MQRLTGPGKSASNAGRVEEKEAKVMGRVREGGEEKGNPQNLHDVHAYACTHAHKLAHVSLEEI